jgi:hypothetical protein
VTNALPSAVTFPPVLALLLVIDDIKVVVTEAKVACVAITKVVTSEFTLEQIELETTTLNCNPFMLASATIPKVDVVTPL